MKPFFTYYGGKWRAAPRYPGPTHGTIVEPFAGSAGYALRYVEHEVILVDKDPNIVETWRFLLSASSGDIHSLPLLTAEQTIDDFPDLTVGERNLIGFWLNKGAAQPCKTPSSWMRSGLRPNSFWGEAIRSRIANQIERIRHWRIIEGNYTDAPNVEATWFIDPPYMNAGKLYRHGATGIDFASLSEWCRSRKGQVIVCEAEGADWLPFEAFSTIKASPAKHGGKKSREVIWTESLRFLRQRGGPARD